MKTTIAAMNAPDMVTSTIGTKNCKNMSEDVMNVLGMGEKQMTNEEARNVIEKYLKCRNEPCNDVRLCSECGLNTNESEQDEAFKLAIEALKCMSLNADIINADAMYKLFITGEMTMEDFRKMCGKELSMSGPINRQDAIDAIYKVFSYAYCDNCEKGMDEDLCGDCHRKYQNWSASKKVIEDTLNNLPSTQPEIIYCKDCAKHNMLHGHYNNGTYIGIEDCCPLTEIRGRAQGHEFDYQYCAHAKRRTDEGSDK